MLFSKFVFKTRSMITYHSYLQSLMKRKLVGIKQLYLVLGENQRITLLKGM